MKHGDGEKTHHHRKQHPDTFIIASNQLSAARKKIAIIENPNEN